MSKADSASANPSCATAEAKFEQEMEIKSAREWKEFLESLGPATRRALLAIEAWFTFADPSYEGVANALLLVEAFSGPLEAAYDRVIDAAGKKDEITLHAAVVRLQRLAEVRAAFQGIEQGWAAHQFGIRLERNCARRHIVNHLRAHPDTRDEDICRFLDQQLDNLISRDPQRQMRLSELLFRQGSHQSKQSKKDQEAMKSMKKIMPMLPAAWYRHIKEPGIRPWMTALKHEQLENRVHKFISVERRLARSDAARRYWAWRDVVRSMDEITSTAHKLTPWTLQKSQQTCEMGMYLQGRLRRTITE